MDNKLKGSRRKREKREKKKENETGLKQDIHSITKSPPLLKISKEAQTDSPVLIGPIVLFCQSFKTYQEKFWTLIALAFSRILF